MIFKRFQAPKTSLNYSLSELFTHLRHTYIQGLFGAKKGPFVSISNCSFLEKAFWKVETSSTSPEDIKDTYLPATS